jgi:uncharacterized membrane protein
MASCPKCGAVVSAGAVFCSVCGSPVPSGSNPVVPSGPPGTASAGLTSNVAAALSYLFGFVTGIIFLVIEPYKRDPFVRFHAFQSIFFCVVAIVFGIIWNGLFAWGFFSFGFLWSIIRLVGVLIRLGFFIYWLFLMYKAYNNEKYLIPYIGELAQKQAG